MLDAAIRNALHTHLALLRHPIELEASLDDSAAAQEMKMLLEELVAASPLIALRWGGTHALRPSFSIGKPQEPHRVRFAGIPLGHEFTSLVLALLHVGGHPPKLDETQLHTLRTLGQGQTPQALETVVSLTCHNCPDVVQALNTLAALNPNFSHTMIDGGLFQTLVGERQVMAVPTVYTASGQAVSATVGSGRMTLEEIIAKLDSNAQARASTKLNDKPVFDVLVVGGGPAGASAAIYAARKGIATGVVAERFGGQVLDTLGIENFISVQATEGPKLVQALEQHVKSYDVDIMPLQKAKALKPEGGLLHIELESGATLRSKTVILSTGARWRELNVPGEQTYKNKGVAYCPHCDGPLFKGKAVAVVGGGNSGVEAAIDLAGIVAHVTLLEFDSKLRADAVLQTKLHSLPNVTVITNAQTTELTGDGQKLSALHYRDRGTDSKSGVDHTLTLDGVFVQIGLLPNTDWLQGTLALSKHKEIEVDAHGQTSLPGVFAAGDCTTVPYKQIIIAMGEGSKAALSAFDHLIRH